MSDPSPSSALIRPAFVPGDNPFASEAWRAGGGGGRRLLGLPRVVWAMPFLAAGAALLAWTLPVNPRTGLRMTPLFMLGCSALLVIVPALAMGREMERLKNSKLFSQLWLTPATHMDFFVPAARSAALEAGAIIGAVNAGLWLSPFFRDEAMRWLIADRELGRLFLCVAALFPALAYVNVMFAALACGLLETSAGRQLVSCLLGSITVLAMIASTRLPERLPFNVSFGVLLAFQAAMWVALALALRRFIAHPGVGERFWRTGLRAEESGGGD